MSFVDFKQVTKSFGNQPVLRGVNFSMKEKDIVVLRGSSGSGKSTLLYLLGGLDQPTSGEITSFGKKISSMDDAELAHYRNRFVGFVFQFHFLLPSMNSRQNIWLPAKLAKIDEGDFENHVNTLVKYLEVEHCLDKFPYQLSGGEQQRINLIRALSLKPKLLLCDEPTGNLDSKNSQKVAGLLRDLAKEFSATMLLVTHDDKIASLFPTKITIEDGQIIS
jgi:lipoprotein-releasing system ATP-binding protein